LFICSLDLPRTGWTSLESLELCGQQPFDTLQILSILAESLKLKDLRIHGSFASPAPGHVQPPQVHLSALETLVIQLESSEGSFQFLDSIVAAPTVTAYIAFALGDAKIEPTWIRTLGRFAAGLERSPACFHIDVQDEYWGVLSPDLKIRFAMRLLRSVEECIQKALEGVGEWLAIKSLSLSDERFPGGEVSLFPAIHAGFPMVRYLALTELSSDDVGSLGGYSRHGWLFPHLSDIAMITEAFRDGIPGLHGIIGCRELAHSKGLISERIRRVTLTVKIFDYEQPEAEKAVELLRECVPELEVDYIVTVFD
ncbi:hypothetical protein FRB90_005154, partial [Tulasnella sp. 427]